MIQRKLAWMLIAMLCPMLSAAATPDYSRYYTDEGYPGWWAGIGAGGGSITSDSQAPSADRSAFTGNIEIGYRLSRNWGLGVEYGVIAPGHGCDREGCSTTSPDFAPDFTRWFLLGEYRPDNSGLRLRASAGVSYMCYSYFTGRRSAWNKFWDAVLFGSDGEYDVGDTKRSCNSLHTMGAALSVGYQWSTEGQSSVGLQLRGEAANYDASSKAGTPAFRHRAVMMQVQFNFN